MRLESLDPRFDVTIDVIKGQEQYIVNAKEVVDITLNFKGNGDELFGKIETLIGKGLPTFFKPEEIEVDGSPLFAEAVKQGGTLHWCNSMEATLALTAINNTGNEIGRLVGLPGRLEGGQSECRFAGTFPDAPLTLECAISRQDGSGPVKLRFDVRKWLGQPLVYLAYFEQLWPFFESVKSCATIGIECLVRGNRILSGTVGGHELEPFKGIAQFLTVVSKARQVAKKLSLNPMLTEMIDREKAEQIDFLFQLLCQGESRKKMPCASIAATFSRSNVRNLLKLPTSQDAPLIFTSLDDQQAPFLGQEVAIGKIETEFTYCTFASDKALLSKQLKNTNNRHLKVEFRASEQGEQIIRQIPS
jgi:hypothetical protein